MDLLHKREQGPDTVPSYQLVQEAPSWARLWCFPSCAWGCSAPLLGWDCIRLPGPPALYRRRSSEDSREVPQGLADPKTPGTHRAVWGPSKGEAKGAAPCACPCQFWEAETTSCSKQRTAHLFLEMATD